MGWWDEGIMGGDTPMDIQGCIEETVFEERLNEGNMDRKMTASLFSERLPAVLDCMNSGGWWSDEESQQIFLQVIGYNILELGAFMPEDLKEKILQACDDDIAFCSSGSKEVGWSNPEKRVQRLKEFREQVEKYEGQPVELHKRGLFEKMSSMESLHCNSCNHINPPKSNFCNKCGKEI